MVCILFLEVEVVVNVNGIPLPTFPIWKGIQQRCPIVLNLFILIGKAFNVIVKRTMENKEIEGVMLLNKVNQHVVFQYVDEKLFTIKGKKTINNIIDILQGFHITSRFELTYKKSLTYWQSFEAQLKWIQNFAWGWAWGKNLSKHLGILFRLCFDALDVDKLFLDKIERKLK